jgi:hypothetical protein
MLKSRLKDSIVSRSYLMSALKYDSVVYLLIVPPHSPSTRCDQGQGDANCPVNPKVRGNSILAIRLPVKHWHAEECLANIS